MSRKAKIGIVSAITALGLAVAATLIVSKSTTRGSLTTNAAASAADASTLTAAAAARVFFGHQSVGGNIIDGIPLAYEAKGLTPPEIIEVSSGTSSLVHSGGLFAHSYIGVNGDPEGKLADFDAKLRAGLADEVDVAMMKFCYVDITAGTDVEALFRTYQHTMAALERDYPEVRFLHLTTPLTTAPGIKDRLKSMVGAGDSDAADNAAREQFNTLMRQTYAADQLFDLAALESTAPDGTRLSGSYDGQTYYSLYTGYAKDDGHLTAAASQVAASRLLTLVASAPV